VKLYSSKIRAFLKTENIISKKPKNQGKRKFSKKSVAFFFVFDRILSVLRAFLKNLKVIIM
jgi:hypothetical protein